MQVIFKYYDRLIDCIENKKHEFEKESNPLTFQVCLASGRDEMSVAEQLRNFIWFSAGDHG